MADTNIEELMQNCIYAANLDKDQALEIFCANFEHPNEVDKRRFRNYARKLYERVVSRSNLRPALAAEFLSMNRRVLEAMYQQGLTTGNWSDYIRFATVMNKTCGFDNPKMEATINHNNLNVSPQELMQRVAQRGQVLAQLTTGAGSGSPVAGTIEVPGSNNSVQTA